QRATLGEHVAWLRRFLEETGIGRACHVDERHLAGLETLLAEVASWQRRHELTGDVPLDARTFHRRLAALADGSILPRTSNNGVRALSAPVARHVSADHVFLIGLGERGFPRPTAEPSLLDDSEREALSAAGLPLSRAADHLADVSLLFYQIVTSARRSLTL